MATTPVDSTVTNTATATSGTVSASAQATVSIVVPPPVARDDTVAGTEDMAAKTYSSVLANDSGGVTAALVSGVSNGTLTFNTDGTFSYKPNANFNGAGTFTYRATAGSSQSNWPR